MSPMNRADYPRDWPAISMRIRARSGQKCEWCGAPNREPHPDTGSIVVLTVAHLGVAKLDGTPGDKHDKRDCRDENLAALCQRCHLNYDRDDHVRHAAETRRRKREDAGQERLAL